MNENCRKIESVINVKVDLRLEDLGIDEGKIITLGLGEGNVAYTGVHCVIINIYGKSLGKRRIGNNVDIIGYLDGYLGCLSAVLLIDRNGILGKRRIGLLGLSILNKVVCDDGSYGHCVMVIVNQYVNVVTVLFSSLIIFGSEGRVNDRGSLIVYVEGEGICIGRIALLTVPVKLCAHRYLEACIVVSENGVRLIVGNRKVEGRNVGIR